MQLLQLFHLKLRVGGFLLVHSHQEHDVASTMGTHLPGSIFAVTKSTWQSFKFFCNPAFSSFMSLNWCSNSATLCCKNETFYCILPNHYIISLFYTTKRAKVNLALGTCVFVRVFCSSSFVANNCWFCSLSSACCPYLVEILKKKIKINKTTDLYNNKNTATWKLLNIEQPTLWKL